MPARHVSGRTSCATPPTGPCILRIRSKARGSRVQYQQDVPPGYQASDRTADGEEKGSMSEHDGYRLSVRFGEEILARGHTAIPNLVLNYYVPLGLTGPELLFTIHVWQHWWSD